MSLPSVLRLTRRSPFTMSTSRTRVVRAKPLPPLLLRRAKRSPKRRVRKKISLRRLGSYGMDEDMLSFFLGLMYYDLS